MHTEAQNERIVSVPKGLVEQLQGLTSKSSQMQYAAQTAPPGTTPRPVNEAQDRYAED